MNLLIGDKEGGKGFGAETDPTTKHQDGRRYGADPVEIQTNREKVWETQRQHTTENQDGQDDQVLCKEGCAGQAIEPLGVWFATKLGGLGVQARCDTEVEQPQPHEHITCEGKD